MNDLSNVDWDLLHRQKLVLLEIRKETPDNSPRVEALSGIIHLVDALQDEAVEEGRWQFPEEDEACQP